MRVHVPTVRPRWRCGLELVVFVSTLLVCAFELAVHDAPERHVRIFTHIEAVDIVDSGSPLPASHWTRNFDGSDPDSSDDNDDDDDDDDGDGLSAELPHQRGATAADRQASSVFSLALVLTSFLPSDGHSLRAPPQ
jgi:hypothetical protein